jgi:hypothetical protein
MDFTSSDSAAAARSTRFAARCPEVVVQVTDAELDPGHHDQQWKKSRIMWNMKDCQSTETAVFIQTPTA